LGGVKEKIDLVQTLKKGKRTKELESNPAPIKGEQNREDGIKKKTEGGGFRWDPEFLKGQPKKKTTNPQAKGKATKGLGVQTGEGVKRKISIGKNSST